MGHFREAWTGNLFAKIGGSSGIVFLKVLFWSERYVSPTVSLDCVLSPAIGDQKVAEMISWGPPVTE